MAPGRPYPLLSALLAERALTIADADLEHLASQTGAAPLRPGLDLARRLLGALEGSSLPPSRPVLPAAPPALSSPVQVPEGLRPLVGELGYLALEMGRHGDALILFALLEALAPGRAAGAVGGSQVLLLAGQPEAAAEAARRALESEAESPEAVASLTEALLACGERDEARRVLATARRPMGPAASWLRLLRLGLDEGWLRGGASCA
ncbi:MAG: tetratricopeptide repeat protein [Deltaproteobacteria bacterium]|nr:tetratricopeptide repeat protein [Deltaproteobacteria bacterium]